ncbi:MAG: hypothetical protein ACXAD7_16770 [Candidatus Kariarchaeaceae archaeon]
MSSIDPSSGTFTKGEYLSESINPGVIYFNITSIIIDPSMTPHMINQSYTEHFQNGSILRLDILQSTDHIDLKTDSTDLNDYVRGTINGETINLGTRAYPSISGVTYTSESTSAANVPLIAPYSTILYNGSVSGFVADWKAEFEEYDLGTVTETSETYVLSSTIGIHLELFKGTYILKSISFDAGWFNIHVEFLNSSIPHITNNVARYTPPPTSSENTEETTTSSSPTTQSPSTTPTSESSTEDGVFFPVIIIGGIFLIPIITRRLNT